MSWVPTGDAIVWAFYRDVLTVDGEPVRDRSTRLDFAEAARPTLIVTSKGKAGTAPAARETSASRPMGPIQPIR